MNLGIGLSLTSFQRVPTVPLEDPDAAIAALFGSGEVGAWYDPSDSSTVWQDAAGTTPAGVGDPVGRIDDKSGNGNHATQTTSAARPVLQQSGDLYYLDFDGVDDLMVSSAFASPIAQPNTTYYAYKLDALSAANEYIFDSLDATNRQSSYYTLNVFMFGGQGPVQFYTATTDAAVNGILFNNASSWNRLNGTQTARSLGTNAFSGITLSCYLGKQAIYCGDLRLYGWVNIDRTLTAAEITDLETYLAAKSGVTL